MRKLFTNVRARSNIKLNFTHRTFSTLNLRDNLAFKSSLEIPSVTIVRDRQHAKKCVELLKSAGNRFHAWDTETLGIDPKENSPVTHGKIICFSCFAGPDIDFGNGPRLFIDNYAECNDLVIEFKEYLENPSYMKVWHNYGFDRHIFNHHGIDVKGFGGDTLHMARMYDTSKLPNEFSLQKLSEIYHDELIKMRKHYLDYLKKKYTDDPTKLKALKVYESFNDGKLKKIDMKTRFQSKKILRTGEEGKSWVMPDIEELHTNPKFIEEWIVYSVLDAEVTYYLRDLMQIFLQSLSSATHTHKNPVFSKYKNNYELYLNYWRPFGELLTEMEREGIKIDLEYLRRIQAEAETDIKLHENKFINWVQSIQPDARQFNPGSTQQMQQLLFGPCYRKMSEEKAKKIRLRRAGGKEENSEDKYIEDEGNFDDSPDDYDKPNNKLVEVLPAVRTFRVENTMGEIENGKSKPLKFKSMTIRGLGFEPIGFTEGGVPAVDQNIVKNMLVTEKNGNSYVFNQFMRKNKDEQKGRELEEALRSFEKFKNIETLLKTFIIPLQQSADTKQRVHSSLNFNTDTGRISARRPNLQNQPSLDKDKYKIRYAFQAEKGKKLIVADYGQLELRILANITECKSMIEAFRLGGDFHSRTALV